MSPIQIDIPAERKFFLFCGLLILPWLPALLVLFGFTKDPNLFTGLADKVLVLIGKTGPLVVADASLFGELSPVLLATTLVLIGPKKHEYVLIRTALLICIIGWLLYILTAIRIDAHNIHEHIDTVLSSSTDGSVGFAVIDGFVTSTRIFYLVVGAAILGIQLRNVD